MTAPAAESPETIHWPQPGEVWSLWDMLPLNLGKLLDAYNRLASAGQSWISAEQIGLKNTQLNALPLPQFASMREETERLRDICLEVDLPLTVVVANELLSHMVAKPNPQSRDLVIIDMNDFIPLRAKIKELQQQLRRELSIRVSLVIPYTSSDLWEQKQPPFGKQVLDAFRDANDDIADAAKCLAVGLGTSCVMHLQRVNEVALKALAAALNVSAQNDWGAYIREIGEELNKRMKVSGKRTDDEQFFAELVVTFEALKRAYRNPSMHADKHYGEDRAKEIFVATRAFMKHLADFFSSGASPVQSSP